MTHPVRLQLRRYKGYQLQEHSLACNGLPAVNVARPSKWGNPFTKDAAIEAGYARPSNWRPFVVECFRDWLGPTQSGQGWWPDGARRRDAILQNLSDIRGKNLACWCGPQDRCHADILLKLANKRVQA